MYYMLFKNKKFEVEKIFPTVAILCWYLISSVSHDASEITLICCFDVYYLMNRRFKRTILQVLITLKKTGTDSKQCM